MTPARFPALIKPQLAKLVESAPDGAGWWFEEKYDGYRILARVHRNTVRLLTRNAKDWADRFASVATALPSFGAEELWLDGEVVAEAPAARDGAKHQFQLLQRYLEHATSIKLRYYVFDLLWVNGVDLRPHPLRHRREILETLFLPPGARSGPIALARRWRSAAAALRRVQARSGEGIIAKQSDAAYVSGRTAGWQKIKCVNTDDFVVGGFTRIRSGEQLVGALLVGQHRHGKLIYMGKVGTGFSLDERHRLYRQLVAAKATRPPFADPPRASRAVWVKPRLVVQIGFTERTQGGRLRHPTMLGRREDKKPREVRMAES